jgi:serine/threonine protein kinase
MTGASEESVFAEALEIEDLQERTAFLDRACAGNPVLRKNVQSLLSAYGAGQFLELPAPAPAATTDDPITERPGTVIGPYKLLEQIGEGGFGIVFMAEQQEPIHRRVALKVLKPGMDSRQVIARFEAERQALALMDHPNIARVIDGGETAAGRPYFVMELVKGIPITDYCDQNQLTVEQRLELFLHVCQAVQHAHQKGIIHRDLKPANVLVTLQDGAALAKVIDFGIAKAIGQKLTDKTLFTGFAQLIGSPLYMSPEQAALSNVDVDTRSDIYSLGVVLYDLLTGTTPFDKERFQGTSYDEMRRIIREEEPPRPSTRISTLGQAATTISEQRKTDPRRLSQLFRGELDWVVMKCLEKDRNRRYETASALVADVQRYLHDEPVQACPASLWYRCRKFARANKVVLAITGCVLAALALGGGADVLARPKGRENEMSESGIFRAALKLSRDQRPAYLDQACGSDQELRREVESLLRAHEAESGFLPNDAEQHVATAAYQPITERPGSVIGPYKLLQEIGEGGFGVVYMAEQEKPVRRMVAVKIIKPGMDSAQVIARFESERQALALMDHPNIAKVLDAACRCWGGL